MTGCRIRTPAQVGVPDRNDEDPYGLLALGRRLFDVPLEVTDHGRNIDLNDVRLRVDDDGAIIVSGYPPGTVDDVILKLRAAGCRLPEEGIGVLKQSS